jgi:hypothetical protein
VPLVVPSMCVPREQQRHYYGKDACALHRVTSRDNPR